MPIVTPVPADLLPTPPTTADPASFDARGDATLLAQQAMVPQVNQLAQDTYTNAVHAEAQATAASQSAVVAANQVTLAQAAAASAQQASGASAWAAGTSYMPGDVVWSPSNLQNHRRKTAGAGTTDPAADPTNWEPITGIKPEIGRAHV